ncbi:PadR family transcriptional regulator [Xanthomonas campestris pv. phormiicola]|nr:PadR family transcriptional regulator [Xanthomonas campestris pv. phormiicola]UYC15757.1 PadR family transcriptional regulator [Xanthomonas campestris pv. phormiicola]
MNDASIQRDASEMRRGVLIILVLLLLKSENHGYAVRRSLETLGVTIKEGTLYPLLRRLESGGYLLGRWDTRGDRMRKFYVITSDGESYATTMFEQFHRLADVVGEVSRRMSPGTRDVLAPAEPVTNHDFQEVSG